MLLWVGGCGDWAVPSVDRNCLSKEHAHFQAVQLLHLLRQKCQIFKKSFSAAKGAKVYAGGMRNFCHVASMDLFRTVEGSANT